MEELWEHEHFGKKWKQSNVSTDSNLSDTFFRLYKDGEKINRKKDELAPQYTFTPQLNRNSIVMANKTFDKRKPLYDSKMI